MADASGLTCSIPEYARLLVMPRMQTDSMELPML